MSEVFDYIIVGGGSAGCVLANRLSADPATRVLLLEAGPPDKDMLIRMPRGIGKMLTPGNPHVWDYQASRGGNHGTEPWLKGRTLGGSSSVNGMVYVRGHPADYDAWEAGGCAGWGWSDIGRCFVALEDHELGPAKWRGAGGPLKVSVHPKGSAVCEAVIRAGEQVGVPRIADVNDPDEGGAAGGIGYQPRTIHKGRRWSAANAFLAPVLDRANLTVRTGALAHRVVFEGRRAVGVDYDQGGEPLRATAVGEVILAAGALHSPALLQLSGVGPAAHLQRLGIAVVKDAPGVGGNLREHRCLLIGVRLTGGSLNQEFGGLRLLGNVLRYQVLGAGPLTHAAHEVCAFVRTRPEYDRPDGQLGFGLYSLSVVDGKVVLEQAPGMTIAAYFMRPESQGSVMIRSADPRDSLSIDANYLSTETDRRHAIDLLRFTRRLLARPALKGVVAGETVPGPAYETDDQILDAVLQLGGTAYHVAGTCRMGADPESVVDPQLRVRGVESLRVVDTSVMPTLVSGNTNGPAMAMALRASELILGDRLVSLASAA